MDEITTSSPAFAKPPVVGSPVALHREKNFKVWDGKQMFLPQDLCGDIRNEFALSMYGELYFFTEESNGMYCPSSLEAKTKHGCKIIDFIGLKDKNKVAISEGDSFDDYGERFVIVWEIRFASFGAFSLNDARIHEITKEWFEEIVIDKNIYENPELLESVK